MSGFDAWLADHNPSEPFFGVDRSLETRSSFAARNEKWAVDYAAWWLALPWYRRLWFWATRSAQQHGPIKPRALLLQEDYEEMQSFNGIVGARP